MSVRVGVCIKEGGEGFDGHGEGSENSFSDRVGVGGIGNVYVSFGSDRHKGVVETLT